MPEQMVNSPTPGESALSMEATSTLWPNLSTMGPNWQIHSIAPPCWGLVEQMTLSSRMQDRTAYNLRLWIYGKLRI